MAEPKERTELDGILERQGDDGALIARIRELVASINTLRRVAVVEEGTQPSGTSTLSGIEFFAEGVSSIASAGGLQADITVPISSTKPVADEEYVKRLLVDTVQKAPGLTLDNPALWEGVANSLLTDDLFIDIKVQDVRLKNAVLDTNQWATTYPDHILTEDVAASLAWAQFTNGDINRQQFNEIRQFASAEAALAEEGSYASQFYTEFARKERNIRDNALASQRGVGVAGGRSADLDAHIASSIAAEEAANIPAGSPRSNRVTPGVDKEAARRQQEAQAFADKGIEDGVDALMRNAFFSPDEADYDDPAEFAAVDRERKKLISDLRGRAASLEASGATPEQQSVELLRVAEAHFVGGSSSPFATAVTGEEGRVSIQEAGDLQKQDAAFKSFMARNGQLTSAITPEDALWLKNQVAATGDLNNFANFDEFLPVLLERKRAEDAREAVSTEAKATSELGRALFERGFNIDDITPGAAFALASGAQAAGDPGVFEDLTDEDIALLQANQRALEDTTGALGAFGVEGAPGSAFQAQVESDVAPFFQERLEEIEADQPFIGLEGALEELLGGPRPSFQEALLVIDPDTGQIRQRTPGGVFEAFQASQQPGVGPFGASQLDPDLFETQMDESQVPGFSPELEEALAEVGFQALPAFQVAARPTGPQFEDIDNLAIQQQLRELAQNDPDRLQFLLNQVGSDEFMQRFLQSSREAFDVRAAELSERGTFLGQESQRRGDVDIPNVIDPITGEITQHGRRAFDPTTEAQFVREGLEKLSADKFSFGDFITSEASALEASFRETPGFLRAEETRAQQAERDELQRQRDIDELEFERRRVLRGRPRRAFT